MRSPVRIDKFLERLDVPSLLDGMKKKFDHLSTIDVDMESAEVIKLINSPDFVRYWEENPDLRFGQLLYNLNLGYMNAIYNYEESEILELCGLSPSQCVIWTSMLNKEGELLDKPFPRFIDELDTDHLIKMISEYANNERLYPESIIKVFLDEILHRGSKAK